MSSSKNKKEYGLGEELPGGVMVDNTLNRPGDILPFGLYNPETEGKLIWMCNYGIEGSEIVSVYAMRGTGNTSSDGDNNINPAKDEKDIKYLASLDEARYVRDELIKSGWLPLKLPEIKFSISSDASKKKTGSYKK